MVRDIAVIGAGPAGLSAAWALTGAGARVTLYERGSEPGGLLRTDELAGAPIDVAVQLLGSYYRETLRLAQEVGGARLLVRSPGRDALWRGGRAHGITYGSVPSMATSSALPTALKLRLASRYLLFLRQHSAVLDPAEPVRAASLDRESIAEWGARELGDQFVELLAYPQLASYYGGEPEGISAGFYHSLARAGLDLDLYAIRGGMRALAEATVARLGERGARLELGVEIESVECAGEVRLEWAGGGARHDAVVLAVPAPVALALGDFADPLESWLRGVRYEPEVALALTLEPVLATDHFGLSFPRIAPPGDRIAAFCMQGAKRAGLTGSGREAMVVVPAPALQPDLLAADPSDALDELLPSIELVYPRLAERIVRAKVYRFQDGRVVFYPGYLTHLKRFDPVWLPPRLALAGDYLVAPTVEGAVRSGLRAAARLLGEGRC